MTCKTPAAEPWLLPHRDGRQTVDVRSAPDWWISAPEEAEAFMRGIEGVSVVEIGRSAGGRPILAGAWGEREELPGRTSRSLPAAIAGGSPAAFYGRGRRRRQSFVHLGAAHACEFEGSVAALHVLNIAVTGKDLRGKPWPRLAAAARQLRLIVIPFYNIDGRRRIAWCRHTISVAPSACGSLSLGTRKDGQPLKWPDFKREYPVRPSDYAFLGATFNDNGYNLVYDHGLAEEPQPETRGLLRFLRDERPDCVLCGHANAGSLVESGPMAFVPERFRRRAAQFSGVVSQRCLREGFSVATLTEADDRGDSYASFYQTDMIYHCCGALPVVVEFPKGNLKAESFDELLDIGLCVFEEILTLGVAKGFIPDWPQDYVPAASAPQQAKLSPGKTR